MSEMKGVQTGTKIFASSIDYKALNQIKELYNHPIFKDTDGFRAYNKFVYKRL